MSGARLEDLARDGRLTMPPPQCITCCQFVNVKTATQFPETGDYGEVMSVEFQCERCANKERV